MPTPKNCFSEFDHFVGLAFKGLTFNKLPFKADIRKNETLGRNGLIYFISLNWIQPNLQLHVQC